MDDEDEEKQIEDGEWKSCHNNDYSDDGDDSDRTYMSEHTTIERFFWSFQTPFETKIGGSQASLFPFQGRSIVFKP